MKKLQNNFTTPKQSKRLLELGVPDWTADCVTSRYGGSTFFVQECQLLRRCIDSNNYIPCWSVGRLMKIIKTCTTDKETLHDFFNMLELTSDELDILMRILADEEGILNMDIDFSKLEE